MEWDVTALATATGLTVDTIRYYQTLGLLHAPSRRGRRAFYDQGHRERLDRIRALADRGFSLRAIAALLDAGDASESDRLLLEAIDEQIPRHHYSAEELARRVGIPGQVWRAVEKAGLAEAEISSDGHTTYTDSDVHVATGALKLLEYGFPLIRG